MTKLEKNMNKDVYENLKNVIAGEQKHKDFKVKTGFIKIKDQYEQ